MAEPLARMDASMSDDMDLPGMWSHSDFTGGDPDERSHAARQWSTGVPEPEPCRLGRIEYDGARYCHEHGGFLEPGVQSLQCDRANATHPAAHTLHDTEESADA